jgi:hypothetical protein
MAKRILSSFFCLLAAFPLVVSAIAVAEDQSAPAVRVELGPKSPVLLQSLQFSPSAGSGAFLRSSRLQVLLVLKNTATKTIVGWTFRVDTGSSALFAHASVSMPSLDLRTGEVVQVPVNVELARSAMARNPVSMLSISLDGVLFTDGSTYGPDSLHSLRTLNRAEAENRHERQYLTSLLRAGRLADIRQELNFGLPDTPPSLSVSVLPTMPSGRSESRQITLTSLPMPNAPMEVLNGEATLLSDGLSAPTLVLRNASPKTILSASVAFLVRDEQANEFVAADLPEQTGILPGKETRIRESGFVRLSRTKGPPLEIRAVAVVITSIEFADGTLWVPARAEIDRVTANPELRRILSDSPERQRLAGLFRRDGINAVTTELRKSE